MNTQTKKVSCELDEKIVNRFVWACANRRKLRLETQDWSVFSKYSESYCRKAMELYIDAFEKLADNIELVTKKKVVELRDNLSVMLDNGKRFHIVL